jgi:hypothetical protein
MRLLNSAMENSSLPSSTRRRGDNVSIGNTDNRISDKDDVAKIRNTLIQAVKDGQLDGWMASLLPLFAGRDWQNEPSLGRVSSSSVQQSARSGAPRDGSSGRRSNPKDVLADGIYHLRYVVKGFLEKQKADPDLSLENGLFPRSLGWFDLFKAGLKAEERKGLHGLRAPGRHYDRIPLGDPDDAWDDEEKNYHANLVQKLRRIREESRETVAALCQKADQSGTTVPWKCLLPAQPPAEPEKRHVYDMGASIVFYGPRSYINCDCAGEGGCRFQNAADDQAFKVAFGRAWCSRYNCTCAPGKQNVKIQGFMSCSWTWPVGLRLVDVPTIAVPEGEVPSGGIDCEWPEALIDNRKEYDNKPDGRCGGWSDEKKQKGRETRAKNKAKKMARALHQTDASIEGNPELQAQQMIQQLKKRQNQQGPSSQKSKKSKSQRKRQKLPAASALEPTRTSNRSTKGQPGSYFAEYEREVDEMGADTQDTDVCDL